MHCTPSRDHRSCSRPVWLAVITSVLLAATAAWGTPAAFADGDPASDVLAQQSVFLPQDAGISPSQQTQLAELARTAGRAGYPVRVAVIASAADLGSITALWGQPQRYAEFLGQELSLVYHGRLLVVMPSGLGVYHAGRAVSAEQSVLTSLPIPRTGIGLGTLALTAIERLAAASGHSIAAPNAAAPAKPGASDTTAWIVFAAGVLLIALAWAASFRARPPAPRRRRAASS
jgi:hypothetical protein